MTDAPPPSSESPASGGTSRPAPPAPLFARPPARERRLLSDALRTETVGGMVLLAAALVALVWANSPLHGSYEAVRDLRFGPAALGLHLSVEQWASDGALTLFFLVAGVELKRELTAGELRRPAAAVLPVVAAVSGMVLPALVCVAVAAAGGGRLQGWSVPMATDIAFALGVLAVVGTHLPSGVRAFLLTLAVVDDLGAILVIAVFYTATVDWAAFAGALAGLVLFRVLHARLRVRGWYVYVPLGVAVWALLHASGVHATLAGVAMGMLLRARPEPGDGAESGGREAASPAWRVEHLVRPLSAGFAVPVFALFAAGVGVSGPALAATFREPESLGVVLGLFAGKLAGVFGGTYLTARFTRARLASGLSWPDVAGVAMLAGVGFTISLLMAELAFTGADAERVKAGVLVGSLASAAAACVLLRARNAKYRARYENGEEQPGEEGRGAEEAGGRNG